MRGKGRGANRTDQGEPENVRPGRDGMIGMRDRGWMGDRGPGVSAGAGTAATLLAVLAVLAMAGPAEAQDPRMNFFLLPVGPGGDQFGAVIVSDSLCHDQGYAAGFGDLQWVAYLDGTAEDGEAGEVARERIGTGPWYNARGDLIAENLAQLHSDASNLTRATAVTLHGEAPPDDFALPPLGAALDGKNFTRDGPVLCFGVR